MERNYFSSDYGNCSMLQIFRTIGCIGDSLSSGEFEYDNNGEKGYWDCYEYSWGKYIERMTGISVTNFSKGGMTAYHLYQSADEHSSEIDEINHLFDKENIKQGYIIALGVNDLKGHDNLNVLYGGKIGSAEDICLEDYNKNAGSFAGWYAKIIQRIQALQPDVKFFLVTMPQEKKDSGEEQFAEVIREIAAKLSNCYVIDLYRDGPIYDENFRRIYFSGHMNAMGYLFTARLILDCADRVIQKNPMDFRFVQFIGSDFKPFAK